jgi:hypothetical protein
MLGCANCEASRTGLSNGGKLGFKVVSILLLRRSLATSDGTSDGAKPCCVFWNWKMSFVARCRFNYPLRPYLSSISGSLVVCSLRAMLDGAGTGGLKETIYFLCFICSILEIKDGPIVFAYTSFLLSLLIDSFFGLSGLFLLICLVLSCIFFRFILSRS